MDCYISNKHGHHPGHAFKAAILQTVVPAVWNTYFDNKVIPIPNLGLVPTRDQQDRDLGPEGLHSHEEKLPFQNAKLAAEIRSSHSCWRCTAYRANLDEYSVCNRCRISMLQDSISSPLPASLTKGLNYVPEKPHDTPTTYLENPKLDNNGAQLSSSAAGRYAASSPRVACSFSNHDQERRVVCRPEHKFKCPGIMCSKQFTRKSHLQRHIRSCNSVPTQSPQPINPSQAFPSVAAFSGFQESSKMSPYVSEIRQSGLGSQRNIKTHTNEFNHNVTTPRLLI